MTEMMRPTDRPMMSLREAMDRLFEQSFTSPSLLRSWTPGANGNVQSWQSFPVNVYEDNEKYYIFGAIPGANPESFDVTIKDNILTISGESKPQLSEGVKPIWQEWKPLSFRREFTLGDPIEADKASVTYENGVLFLALPKAEKVRTKKIKVQSAR